MVQSITEEKNVFFKVHIPNKDNFIIIDYKVDIDFKFRNYDTTNIGDCDFYDVSQKELNLIYKYSVRTSPKIRGIYE